MFAFSAVCLSKRNDKIVHTLGYVIHFLNLSSKPGVDLFCAEFQVDSESGLKIDLGGRISDCFVIALTTDFYF